VNASLVAVVALSCLALGYKFYGDFIVHSVFGLEPDRPTPAHELRDGVDYVPSNKWVLFGHHFSSISGLGPILGPAIAVIWGWVPAVLWVIFGTLIIGAVHDYTTMSVSVRNEGRSIGDVASGIINERSRLLFLVLIFFLISLAMGVFAYVIAILFAKMYPATVLPVFALMVIAVVIGSLVRTDVVSLKVASVIGIVLLGLILWHSLGIEVIKSGSGIAESLVVPLAPGQTVTMPLPGVNGWTYFLMGYAFVASVLPVWLLLQPRDYLNSFLLYAGLIALYGGLFWLNPSISAPALTGTETVADLPPLFPVLFITIACGAVSGFHSLVSSGTTAKQLDSESDGKLVGFGGMVAEGVLALIVALACVAGLGGFETWSGEYYSSWAAVDGLGPKLKAFIDGGANFIEVMGVPEQSAAIFISLVVVSFAMTTLDSGTRLLRYNIEELADTLTAGEKTSPAYVNRWTSSLVAVVAIGFFALLEVDGQPAGIYLWVLFGASNQLLASLGLLTVTVYLYKRNRPVIYTIVPMVFMIIVTTMALLGQMYQQMPMMIREPLSGLLGLGTMPDQPGSWPIFVIVLLIMVLSGWFIVEAINTYRAVQPDQ
jgi:carbon starvation protein